MKHPRTKSCCSICTLKSRQRIWGEGPDSGKPLVAIFGSEPSRDEDREKQVFIGGTGNLLNWAIASSGIRRNNCFLSNLTSCHAPDERELKDAIGACRGGFFQDLDYLAEVGCNSIIALGEKSMRAFGISGGLKQNRGSVYEYKHKTYLFHVIPTFEPLELMAKHWKLDGGGNGNNGAAWIADFKKAVSIAQEGWTEIRELFNVSPTVADVEKFASEVCAKKSLIAVDTETTGLGSNAKVVVIGLADTVERGICVPVLAEHGIPYFKPSEWPIVEAILQKIFSTCPLLFQNASFDIPMLQRMGFEINIDAVEDTLLLHHTLSPESEHNLGFITSVYGKTPYWKEEFKNRSVSIFEMNQISMRTYNLRDCVVLHQVRGKMLEDLKDLNLIELYNVEVKKILAPVLEMRNVGMGIDMTAMLKFKKHVIELRDKYDAELRSLGGICDSLNFASDAELRWFLFAQEPSKFAMVDELEKSDTRIKTIKYEQGLLEEELAETKKFLSMGSEMPPKSLAKFQKKLKKIPEAIAKKEVQLQRILSGKKYAELLRLKAVREVKPIYTLNSYKPMQTESEQISVDAESLLSYKIALNNRLKTARELKKPPVEEIENIEKLLKWLELWHYYSQADKLETTYTKYSPDDDGRIRPNWKAWGTATSRLSCSSPNLMNLPKRKDDEDDPAVAVREFFVAKPGHKFISCDYVNLEVYLLAYETLDPELLAVTEKGLNIHDLNTRALFAIDDTHPHWKTYRAAAKIFQFGRLNYGGSDYGVYRKVMLKVPEMQLTGKEFAAASARWMELHPAYVEWKNALEVEVKATRRTRNEFGRLRIFFGNEEGIVREALSTRIQGSGASLMNRAMRRIYDARNELKLEARFVCQVHDQLIMEAPDAEVELVSKLMKEEMEKPFMYKGFERKVQVDLSIGTTFGAL